MVDRWGAIRTSQGALLLSAAGAPPGAAGKATSGTLACTFLGVILGAPRCGLTASGACGFAAAFGCPRCWR